MGAETSQCGTMENIYDVWRVCPRIQVKRTYEKNLTKYVTHSPNVSVNAAGMCTNLKF